MGISTLARNIQLNFAGLVVPLALMLFTVPYVVHGLGPERYGVIALLSTVLGLVSHFDLGVGQATTKLVSEALGRGDVPRVRPTVSTAVMVVALLGSVGTLALWLLTEVLVGRVFHVGATVLDEARFAFHVYAALIPFRQVNRSLLGVLEGYQRFDLVTLLRLPSTVVYSLIPVVVLTFSGGLRAIALAQLAREALVTVAGAMVSGRLLRAAAGPPSQRVGSDDAPGVARELLGFGGWLTLQNLGIYGLLNIERYILVTLTAVETLTFYTVPSEIVTGMTVVPASIMGVLFPAFSSLYALDRSRLERLFGRALKVLVLIAGLLSLLVVVLARDFILLWLGPRFERSIAVLQILAAGQLLASIGWLFGTLLVGTGHVRAVTLVFFAQLPIHSLLTWLFVSRAGLVGAAWAWTIPQLMTTPLFLWVCLRKRLLTAIRPPAARFMAAGAAIVLLALLAHGSRAGAPPSVIGGLVAAVLFTAAYGTVAWGIALDPGDRQALREALGSGAVPWREAGPAGGPPEATGGIR